MLQSIAEMLSFVVLEYIVEGPGYVICRVFVKKEALKSEHLKVAVAGLLFWVAVIAVWVVIHGA